MLISSERPGHRTEALHRPIATHPAMFMPGHSCVSLISATNNRDEQAQRTSATNQAAGMVWAMAGKVTTDSYQAVSLG
jgi:hypothetical protein